jgi:hypothetical protein
MSFRVTLRLLLLPAVAALALAAGCGDDTSSSSGAGGDGGSDSGSTSSTSVGGTGPEGTGEACVTADDCYAEVVDGELSSEAICLDKAVDGYCTHACATDEDCCAAEGECAADAHQVCSPFESTGQTMCFLSCEDDDVGDGDPEDYCQRGAGRDFTCRSSGGGSDNRKICFPGVCGVGATCGADLDCASGLTCVLSLLGGYCSQEGCTTSDDCPADTRCVSRAGEGNVCLRTCAVGSDCSFCRGTDEAATCSDDAEFVDGSPVQVCVPSEL